MNAPYHSHEAALLGDMRAAGITPVVKAVLNFDGKVCRFDLEGRKRGKKHGWFVGHSEGLDAWGCFGDWSTGFQQSWSLRNRQTMSEAERIDLERRITEARMVAEAERQRLAIAAASKALEMWDKAGEPSADHPYIRAKEIIPYGAKQIDDALLIPLRLDGELVNMQIIKPDGTKRFMTGGQVKGASLVLGQLDGASTVLVCEGWGTGCSLHQATSMTTIVTFNAGNMAAVAERLTATIPDGVQVLACADNDTSGTGQKAASKAAMALAPRGSSVIPVFTPEQVEAYRQQHGDKPPSDFNDLAQLAGMEAVNEQVLVVAGSPAIQTHGGSIANIEYQDTTSRDPSATALPTEEPSIPSAADEDAYLRYLAELKPLAYGRKRKDAADALGVPVGILDKLVTAERKELAAHDEEGGAGGCILFDEIEPWPVEVDAASVLDGAFALLRQYVIADKETLRAAALWAAMTWFVDYATVLPLAVITAPEKGCGKSTLLQALAKLACRPLYASNITPSALFRAVEAWKPTLMIDEADSFAKDNEELRGILNCGHTRDTATVVRVVEIGGELQPRAFSVWGAKALAGIGTLPETIMSRSVVLTMRRKTAGERADVLRHADAEAFRIVKRQLARWADDMGETFATSRPDVGSLNNRTADNWEPLLVLADLAAGEWPKWARMAAAQLTGGEEEAVSMNEELLRDIRTAFDQRKATKMWTSDLIDALCQDEEAPWSTFNFRQGKPITARQLSKRLGEFGIKPIDIRERFEVRKGYRLEDFTDAFARYLDGGGNLSATTLQANNDGAFRVADGYFSEDEKNLSATLKPAPNKECSVVADRNGGSGKNSEGVDDAEYF